MNIEIFKNKEFGEIRTVIKNNEVWFVAKDLAKALGYTTLQRMYDHVSKEDSIKINPQSKEYRGLCENGSSIILEPNPNVFTLMLINESGLYDCIFGSTLPEAKQFKRWVTSEVLPSIRKHGAYMTEATLERAITDSDFLIQLATQLKIEQQKRKELEIDNKVMKPKAEYFDDLVDKKLLTNFRDTAKELGMGQKKLVAWLLDNDYLYRDTKKKLKAYQHHVDNGLFEYKDFVKGNYTSTQTLVTVKGKETIRLLIK